MLGSKGHKGLEDQPLDARRELSALEGWILEVLHCDLKAERKQGFYADPFCGRARCSPMLGVPKHKRPKRKKGEVFLKRK